MALKNQLKATDAKMNKRVTLSGEETGLQTNVWIHDTSSSGGSKIIYDYYKVLLFFRSGV